MFLTDEPHAQADEPKDLFRKGIPEQEWAFTIGGAQVIYLSGPQHAGQEFQSKLSGRIKTSFPSFQGPSSIPVFTQATSERHRQTARTLSIAPELSSGPTTNIEPQPASNLTMSVELKPEVPSSAFTKGDPRLDGESLVQCGHRLWQQAKTSSTKAESNRYENFICAIIHYKRHHLTENPLTPHEVALAEQIIAALHDHALRNPPPPWARVRRVGRAAVGPFAWSIVGSVVGTAIIMIVSQTLGTGLDQSGYGDILVGIIDV
ncbi:MAG: hypothetical protein Q9170_007495 [Blastenia crenularia]